jgi:hypothetical protein
MPGTEQAPQLKTYIVVGRCRASAFIDENESLGFNYKYGSNAPADITFQSRFLDKKFEVKVPEEFWIEATGTNVNLISAAEVLANGAKDIANIIALSVNASIGPIEVELAYDGTPGSREREYFQSFVPDKTLNHVPGRKVNCDITTALVGAIGQHPDKDKIMRAVSQYSIALDYWSMGSELPCVSHLFMGMEALKGVTLKHHIAQTGVTKEQLAKQWGYNVGGKETINQYLDHEVRKRILFQNDADTHRKAKKASDGLEHGLTNFGALRPFAREVIVLTAKYLRTAILDLAGLDQDRKETILAKPYDTPRGPSKIVKYIWGKLSADTDHLAAHGQMYPIMYWKSSLTRVFKNDAGGYSFSPTETFTLNVAPGVRFTPDRYEVWDGSTIQRQDKPQINPVRFEAVNRKQGRKLLNTARIVTALSIGLFLFLVWLIFGQSKQSSQPYTGQVICDVIANGPAQNCMSIESHRMLQDEKNRTR